MRRRIGIVCAWPRDVARGSGTARFVLDLGRALRERGATVLDVDSGLDTAAYASFVLRRLAWNLSLPDDPRLSGLDAVLAVDYDGLCLPGSSGAPLTIACPQAVYAALAETEPEPFRSYLLVQAEAEKRSLATAAAVIVPSRFVAESVVRCYGIARSRIHLIPHGIYLQEWEELVAARRTGRRAGTAILAVAKLYPRKGIDLLLHAAAILRGKIPGLSVRIVGDGFERERLESLADRLGLRGTVFFEGDVAERERVAGFYAGSDLFCLPSRYETFGFAFLEAMAAGLPVVALDAGAAPEVIGDAGRLVTPEDPLALADALRGLLDDPALARSIGERARARATLFSWPAAADQYLKIVELLLTGGQDARTAPP